MSYKEQAEALGIKVDGRWSEERIQAEILKVEIDKVEPGELSETSIVKSSVDYRIVQMNDLAMRIYEGQGSIPDIQRVHRIVFRLENHGYLAEEIAQLDIPIKNLSKYLG